MTEQEIKDFCKELQEALIDDLKSEGLVVDAMSAKERTRKRVQLAKIFLDKK